MGLTPNVTNAHPIGLTAWPAAGFEPIPRERSRPVRQQAFSFWVAVGLDQVRDEDGRDRRDDRGGHGPTAATSVDMPARSRKRGNTPESTA